MSKKAKQLLVLLVAVLTLSGCGANWVVVPRKNMGTKVTITHIRVETSWPENPDIYVAMSLGGSKVTLPSTDTVWENWPADGAWRIPGVDSSSSNAAVWDVADKPTDYNLELTLWDYNGSYIPPDPMMTVKQVINIGNGKTVQEYQAGAIGIRFTVEPVELTGMSASSTTEQATLMSATVNEEAFTDNTSLDIVQARPRK